MRFSAIGTASCGRRVQPARQDDWARTSLAPRSQRPSSREHRRNARKPQWGNGRCIGHKPRPKRGKVTVHPIAKTLRHRTQNASSFRVVSCRRHGNVEQPFDRSAASRAESANICECARRNPQSRATSCGPNLNTRAAPLLSASAIWKPLERRLLVSGQPARRLAILAPGQSRQGKAPTSRAGCAAVKTPDSLTRR